MNFRARPLEKPKKFKYGHYRIYCIFLNIMKRPQNLKKSPTCFDKKLFLLSNIKIREVFSGLFRKAGLYYNVIANPSSKYH